MKLMLILGLLVLPRQGLRAQVVPDDADDNIAPSNTTDADGNIVVDDDYEVADPDPPFHDLNLGDACRSECIRAIGYGSGFCAAITAFGAPLICSPGRLCELCKAGYGFLEVYNRQVLVDNTARNVSNLLNVNANVKKDFDQWAENWHMSRVILDLRISHAAHFEDMDYLFYRLSEVKFSDEGVPVDNQALQRFNETALSSGRGGAVRLINNYHRMLVGGGFGSGLGGRKSLFEMDRRFCDLGYLEHLDKTQLGLYSAFFFAAKISGFDDVTNKYGREFVRMREEQRNVTAAACAEVAAAEAKLLPALGDDDGAYDFLALSHVESAGIDNITRYLKEH